jgi:hypothetical protein
MKSKKHHKKSHKFVKVPPQNVKIIKCLLCDKTFTTKRSMQRHMKTSCMEIKKTKLTNKVIEDKDNEIKELKKQFQNLQNKVDFLLHKSGTNNNINNGVINNIIINAYDDTDVSFLTDNDYRNCLKQRYLCIPSMVGKIHCNPSHPENMNIVIKNFKNAFLDIFKGKHWERCHREAELRRLVIRTTGKLEDWLSSLPDDSKYDHIRTLGEMVISGTEDEAVLDRIFKEIQLILYNNRHFIIEPNETETENDEDVMSN